MSQQIHALTHGFNGLILGYAIVLIPMLVALRQGRAPVGVLLRGPLWAIPVTLVAGIVVSIASSPLRSLGVDREGLLQAVFGTLICIGVGYVAGRLSAARKRSPDAEHRRGATVTDSQEFQGSRRTGLLGRDVTLAGIPVAPRDETKHFKLIGTTGTGKSTAIRELLEGALARGDRAIIADPDGGYMDTFHDADRGDVILNPFTAGSAKWNLLGEITNDYDVEQLARSLIPDSGDPDRMWSEYARTLFVAIVQQVISIGVRDDSEVNRLVTQASDKELRELLTQTSAGPLLAEGNEKMCGCVRAITTSALRSLKYVTRQEGAPFSVREWVSQGAARQAGGTGGVLFIPYKAGEIAALRSMISAWMRLAIFEAMNRGEGDQRLWFVVDELDALGEIDGLKDALARLRKFGGRSVLGFQSIAQVSSTYGKGVADTIVENCGNTLILRCSASEHGGTSEFASKLIGQREVTHTTQSRTRRAGEWRSSTTRSEQVKIEPAVMASEIERLRDLEGFLKFASTPDWRRVALSPPRARGRGENKQRAGEAPAAGAEAPGSGAVAPEVGGAISAAPTVSGPFATSPLASAHSGAVPKPRAVRKPVGTRTRKPRGQAIKSNGAAAGAASIDNQASPP